jgi:hypothetical protein
MARIIYGVAGEGLRDRFLDFARNDTAKEH